MAEMSFFDGLVNNVTKLAAGYSQIELAKKGIPAPVETRGASSPVVAQGAPAAVKVGEDFLSNVADSASKAYAADRIHKSMPLILGAVVAVVALGALIYGLRK